MAYIYKITNTVNNKVYIGKTSYTVEKRFQQHCTDSKKLSLKDRPLYRAFNKYGIENFTVEIIEEVSEEESSIREIYWIDQYGSYNSGYNATLGGEGKSIYNHQEIINMLKEIPYPKIVSSYFNCSTSLIQDLAKANEIQLRNRSNDKMRELSKKMISQYDKMGNHIQNFDAIADAAKWCFENGLCSDKLTGVRGHISEVANGKRKSAYGYIWKYKE